MHPTEVHSLEGFHSRLVKVCEFYEDLPTRLALRGLSCIRLGEEADNIKNELKLSKNALVHWRAGHSKTSSLIISPKS